MGIDITGTSNLIIKPVPKKYRANLTYREPLSVGGMLGNLSKVPREDQQGALALTLVISGADMNFINPDFDSKVTDLNLPPDAKVSDESYKWMEHEGVYNGLLYVNWESNNAYYRTTDSDVVTVSRGYSDFSDFCKTIREFTSARFYFPCDGVLDAQTCFRYYSIMSSIWKQWRDKYAIGYDLPAELSEIPDSGTDSVLTCEVEFYIKLGRLLKYGSESGIALCH
jgi:hypothetical protein